MASFKVAVSALALFAFVQVSVGTPFCGNLVKGCGCGDIVDLDIFSAPIAGRGLAGFYGGFPGYGYGAYGFGNGYDCCCEPVTEVTTVSCVPVVETHVEPGYASGYGFTYGFPGGHLGGAYSYPGYGYGVTYGHGCGCGRC